jgi:hypothetical protein
MSLDAHDVAYVAAQERPVELTLQHPNDLQLQGTLKENVWRLLEAEDPENTKKAFEPKMKEYFEFCKTVYPHDPHFNILNRDKMYRFMYFQAFREKKKRGGRILTLRRAPLYPHFLHRQTQSQNVPSLSTKPPSGSCTTSRK